MGLRVILLTGDAEAIASAVARELAIDEVEAGLLPTGKLARIDALLAESRTVAMVGDGINDAPALMRASVGVAMGSGTDVARESAPVVLLGNDLRTVAETLRIARRCRRIRSDKTEARAVRTEQRDDLARRHLEAHAVEGAAPSAGSHRRHGRSASRDPGRRSPPLAPSASRTRGTCRGIVFRWTQLMSIST
jgi:haloacid dehalogenase-like hydrolase